MPSDRTDKPKSPTAKQLRQARLEEQLRANLRRRKDAARARQEGERGGSGEAGGGSGAGDDGSTT